MSEHTITSNAQRALPPAEWRPGDWLSYQPGDWQPPQRVSYIRPAREPRWHLVQCARLQPHVLPEWHLARWQEPNND